VIILRQIRCAGNGVVLPSRESPRAPLLRIVHLQDPRDQGGTDGWRDLVGTLLGAGAVEVRAGCTVGGVGVEGFVLCAEAGCCVD
jgi:hypothetical protein